jgi:prolyl oligopeptidase
MKLRCPAAAALLALAAGDAPAADWTYPAPITSDAADVFHGRRYQDPYRPLEAMGDKSVDAWFKAQADLADAVLGRIPGRDTLVKEWESLDARTPPRYQQIQVEGGRVFYRKTMGGETIGRIFVRDAWTGPERLLFDPAGYKQGVKTVVNSFLPSWDGKHLLLGLTAVGAEWSELRVLQVDGGKLLPESIYPSYGGQSWLPEGNSFLYDAGDATDVKSMDNELNRKTRLHRLGTPVAGDRDVFSNVANPELGIQPQEMPAAQVSESAPRWLLGVRSTVQSEIFAYVAPLSDLEKPKVTWRRIADPRDGLVRALAIHGNWIYAVTYVGAPRYKLVRTPLDRPDWKHAGTVLAEAGDSIEQVSQSKDFLLVQYSDGVNGRLVRVSLADGSASTVTLPMSGAVDVTCPDAHGNRCVVAVSGWLTPTVTFDLDAEKGAVGRSPFNTDVAYPEFERLVVEEVEVPSHDGVLVPVSIIRPREMKMDGSTPCVLEGYGAYGISYTPFFNVRTSLAGHGVVVAFAHVRGGGEKGESWYRAGYKATKPNTWKDFVAAAEWLVQKGYTSPGRLAGRGTSAGGVLISRAITERPDLFAASVINVGLGNALRFEFSSNGPVNTPEFGRVQDPGEATALFEMDGLQHVQPGVRYPAVLGVAGWNDPRVAVWQPAKFVAAVQQASTSGRPALLKVNYDNGHFTEDKSVTFRNFADQHAFCLWQAGHPEFQPSASTGRP